MYPTFSQWLLAKEMFVPDYPTIDNANRPDLAKAGTGDTSKLPMGMRTNKVTSANQTFNLKDKPTKNSKRPGFKI